MDQEFIEIEQLSVARPLFDFIDQEALPGSGVESSRFWAALSELVNTFGPRNRQLLDRREALQGLIDEWHRERRGKPMVLEEYREFLSDIGYLVAEGPDFGIETQNVDSEIALIPGPQLIVPVTNARYALNAANARWGSLYDALYGTDALGSEPPEGPYDERRGADVISWARDFLDRVIPLSRGSHSEPMAYRVVSGRVEASMSDGGVGLADPSQFVGYTGSATAPQSLFFRHHGLHLEVVMDRFDPVGAADRAGISDVVLEAAITTIVDCEDSVAVVDGADKAAAYRNWLGLINGDLEARIVKDGRSFTRRLREDREITAPNGAARTLPGRSLLMVRNVGHLMTTPAVLDGEGREAYEGLVDAMCTVLIGAHDLVKTSAARNSRVGSIYVVKPKMHGPTEVALTNDIFSFVEDALGLARDTVKIGVMDEERRTTLNLKECVRAVKSRVAFINTGFLDRTGDEIHTSMEAGPMVPKTRMKEQRWLPAYEDWNVDVGLACGFHRRAQIGKGMWAAPDSMNEMMTEKVAHPRSGANCAWVPSPSAATLHATHYHDVDVLGRQEELLGLRRVDLDDLLEIPVGNPEDWSAEDITWELENNAQGILGYVVRWVDQGIGCSKVPNIENVPLMEDRATCRISSQHIANWLHHGVVTAGEVMAVMSRMAAVVDEQNRGDPAYEPMAPGLDGLAFRAACDLVLTGVDQPSGYTEPSLHARRIQRKEAALDDHPT